MELVRRLKVSILCFALFIVTFNIGVIIYQSIRMYIVQQEQIFKLNAIKRPVRFFQIGFSKCGTKSLVDFFNMNGVPSIHHDGGHLAINMYINYQQGKPLLSDVYDVYYGFFDMERLYDEPLISIPQILFKELDKQYPGSKFIFNIRDKQAWLKSKAMHPAYHHKMRWIDLHAKFLNKTRDEVLAHWSKEWDDHYNEVLEYFKDRPDDLLIFDIENDSPKKICEFFKEYFVLNHKYYKHINKSIDRDKRNIIDY